MTEHRIETIMRADLPTLRPETPIRRAVADLVGAHADAALVIDDDGRLAGILTQKDCFRPVLHASYYQEWTGCVADHMTREVVSVEAQDDIVHVAEMFMTHPHRVFPVFSDAKVAGLVHRSDVLALLSRIG